MTDSENWTTVRTDLELQQRIEAELPALLRLARRLTRDEQAALDAVQDCLERGWRGRRQLRDPRAAGSWLRAILARTVVDAHRRQAGVPMADLDELGAAEPLPDVDDPVMVLIALEDDLALRAALRTLAPLDRLAVTLHDAEGLQASELAELLGVSTDAAHKRVQRARARLLAAVSQPSTVSARAPSHACRDARSHAHDLIDGTLDEATRAEVQAHLDTCPRCPATLQAAAAVLGALAARHPDEPVPESLQRRVQELVTASDEAR